MFESKASHISNAMSGLETFIQKVRLLVCDCDELVPAYDDNIVAMIKRVETITEQGDVHVGGFKEMSKRYNAMVA